MSLRTPEERLTDTYHRLLAQYGPQQWWPAGEPFEVIVGAILTQSTAWTNVEKAIANLKAREMLSPQALRCVGVDELASLIRPSGYYNAKAMKVKSFVEWLGRQYDDNLHDLFAMDIASLRQKLLLVYGIGEETADSIILYAAEKPIFVIDAYTRRIFQRLGFAPPVDTYSSFQSLFMKHLPHDESLFNEYHALLVKHGKETCRKVPKCNGCCLGTICVSRKRVVSDTLTSGSGDQ